MTAEITKKDNDYIAGYRDAIAFVLLDCMKYLGYEDVDAKRCAWVMERETTITALREICEDFGDNEWEENLSLADVVEKHLARHLYDKMEP